MKASKNLGAGYAIGYIIAGVVLLPLLIFGINKLFFQGNNDADKYIHQYMNNSVNLKVYIPEVKPMKNYDYNLPLDDPSRDSGFETYTAFLSKKRGGKIDIRFFKFFSKEYHKFFSIRLTNMGSDYETIFSEVYEKKNVIITVNKDDLGNPNMGTKESPVPVFKIVGDVKPLGMLWNSGPDGNIITEFKNVDITQSQYENSVYCHLKYVMPKEEFKKRFESK